MCLSICTTEVRGAVAVLFDELFALDEHPGRTAAGIIDAALVRGEHFNQHTDHAVRGIELAAVLLFGAGELRQEVFVDAAQDAVPLDGFSGAARFFAMFASPAVSQLLRNETGIIS